MTREVRQPGLERHVIGECGGVVQDRGNDQQWLETHRMDSGAKGRRFLQRVCLSVIE